MHLGDTALGQTLRVLSRGKLFGHLETSDRWPPSWLARMSSSDLSHDASLDKLPSTSATPSWLTWTLLWDNALQKARNSPSKTSSQPKDGGFQSPRVVTDDEVPRDALVSWYGPDDPANPQNWSTASKIYVTGVICLYTFTVYLGSAIYTPSIPGVMEQFGVSYAAASLGLSLFVFGCKYFAFSCCKKAKRNATPFLRSAWHLHPC